VIKHTLQSSEIFNCLKFNRIPEPKYDFPVRAEGKHNRTFRYKNLEIFPWLVYSEIKKEAYRKLCVVFAFSGGDQATRYITQKIYNTKVYDFGVIFAPPPPWDISGYATATN
jgi:hypothetical protein